MKFINLIRDKAPLAGFLVIFSFAVCLSQDAGYPSSASKEGIPPHMKKRFDEYKACIKEAEKAIERKEYDVAIGHYEKALKVLPGDGKAFAGLGDVLDKVGRYEESYKAYHELIFDRRIISSYSTDVIVLDRYASVCEKLGKTKEAYEAWQMILDQGKKAYLEEFFRHINMPLKPNEVKGCAKLLVSIKNAATGGDTVAVQFSQASIELLPDFAPANYYHALFLKYVKKYKESLAFFKKTLSLCKSDKALRDKAESHIKDVEHFIRRDEKEAAKKNKK